MLMKKGASAKICDRQLFRSHQRGPSVSVCRIVNFSRPGRRLNKLASLGAMLGVLVVAGIVMIGAGDEGNDR